MGKARTSRYSIVIKVTGIQINDQTRNKGLITKFMLIMQNMNDISLERHFTGNCVLKRIDKLKTTEAKLKSILGISGNTTVLLYNLSQSLYAEIKNVV